MNIIDWIKNVFAKKIEDDIPFEAMSAAEAITVESLYSGDKDNDMVNGYVRNLRAWVGELSTVINHATVLGELKKLVQKDLDLMKDEDVIKDGSGLAGAQELNKAEVATMTGILDSVLVSMVSEEKSALYEKAAGTINVIG